MEFLIVFFLDVQVKKDMAEKKTKKTEKGRGEGSKRTTKIGI